jgi:glycosyltransferase involved in cell wall biosynthesis
VARRLVAGLAETRPDIPIDVFVLLEDRTMNADGVWPVNVSIFPEPFVAYRWGPARSVWEQAVLPLRIRRARCYNVLLNLTNSAPVVVSPGVPQIVLVHDAGFVNREWFTRAFSLYLTLVVRTAARCGASLTTISGASAADLGRILPEDHHVTVIPNGVDAPIIDRAPKRFDWPYALFLGSLNPRKNLRGAIAAIDRVRAATGEDLRLVVIGQGKDIFAGRGEADACPSFVEFAGYADDREKWAYLRGAELLLMPSFLEGFGLPVAEALRVGTPVVASDIAVFRELYRDTVEYVDPRSPASIADGIHRILKDRARHAVLAQRGRELVERFTWVRAAEAYWQLIDVAVGKGRS